MSLDGNNTPQENFPRIQYSGVKPSQLTPETLTHPIFLDRSETKDLSPAKAHAATYDFKRGMAELNRVEPSRRVLAAVEFAKKMILSALGKDTPESRTRTDVVFLPPGPYKYITKSESFGTMFAGITPVFVMCSKERFDFEIAATTFHELVHAEIDLQLHAFHSTADNLTNTTTTYIEQRRQGLEIRKLIRDHMTGEVIDSVFVGTLMNELGNLAWQKIFTHFLFTHPEMSLQFQDEIEFQQQKLREIFGPTASGSCTVTVPDESGIKHQIFFYSSNLQWNRSGQLEITPVMLAGQILDDLSDAIGNLGYANMTSCFIDLKIWPERQRQLQKAVDKKFGQGFYKKMRETPYTNVGMTQLLAEIQRLMRRK